MTAARYRLTIAFVALCGFVMLSDFSALSVALPSIAHEPGITPTDLSLIGSISTLMFASFLIPGGRLTDRYGGVRTCLLGLALYGAGALIAATASRALALVVGRALGGLSFALLGPAAFAKLTAGLPPGPVRDRGVGIYAGTQGAGMIAGSVLGGAVTTYLGWRAVFLMSLPMLLVTLALGVLLLRREPEQTRGVSLDALGAVLFAAGTALIIRSLTKVGEQGWRSHEVLATLGAAVMLYALFGAYERSRREPLIPLALFREPRMIANTAATLGIMSAAAAMFILPNLTMQRVMGYSAAQSGFGMLPQALTNITMGGVLAYAVGRFTFRRNLSVASAVYLAGLGLFMLLPMLRPHAGYALLIGLPLVLSSFGGSFGAFTILASSTARAPAQRQGLITSVVMSAQQVGLALGVALVLAISASGVSLGGDGAALRDAHLACLAAALLGALCALLGRHDRASPPRAELPAGLL